MTTITREHLELAAKAAGYTDVDFSDVNEGGTAWRVSGELGVPWQPHIESLDTWQLAADCGLGIDFDLHFVYHSTKGDLKPVDFGDDANITAAEAVTLAAAEIGRAMG